MDTINTLKDYLLNYQNFSIKLPMNISKNLNDSVIIWKSTLNSVDVINITSVKEYNEEKAKQNYDYRISDSNIIFKTYDGSLVSKIKNIALYNGGYDAILKGLIELLSIQKENYFEEESIKFLRKLLYDYENYNITRYINVSLFAELEKEKSFPCIVIWEDLDGRINVNSKSEYNVLMKIYNKRYSEKEPKILFEVNDKDKIIEILETLISYRNYDDKITSLIYILNDKKELKLK